LVSLRDEDDEEEGTYYENGKKVKTESGYGKLPYSPSNSAN